MRIEEKKDGRAYDGAPDAALYSLAEEKTLAKAIDQVKAEASAAVAKEDFAATMSVLARLRPAVDAFFDKVKVNDDDPKVRENRLKLLNEIRARDPRGGGFLDDTGLIHNNRHCERSEAIHRAATRKSGLLRRFAPRNEGEGGLPDGQIT